MSMPNNLILVRHGESEGNIAVRRSKRGDDSAFSEEFRNRHSSLWRLSSNGVTQAQTAGAWIKKHIPFPFDRFYTSEYLRAMETAAYLGLPDASWFSEFYLRERSWGTLERVTVKEREEKFYDAMQEREVDAFYWTPPGGESLADLCLRIDRVIQTLHRECAGKNVIIVCHGEVMWAFRVRLERMTQEQFHELDSSRNPVHRIHNCQLIHYTRVDPDSSHADLEPAPYLNWVRSVCTSDESLSDNSWKRILRPRFSNDELLKRVSRVKPVVL